MKKSEAYMGAKNLFIGRRLFHMNLEGDPLWAVEPYISEKQQKHFHFLSLGFSNLGYDEAFAEDEINGFGFEISFRYAPCKGEIEKPVGLLIFCKI